MSPQGGGPWGYRLTHITKVSAARVHLTDKLAHDSRLRPDPEAVAAQIRAAKRQRLAE